MTHVEARLKNVNLQVINILQIYKQSTEDEILSGKQWYHQASDISKLMAVKYQLTDIQTAGIIAALSPGTNWSQNIIDANNLCSLLHVGKDIHSITCTTYNKNKLKAHYLWLNSNLTENEVFTCLLGASKHVNKTSSFFINILHPESSENVTIDRHAFRINLGITELPAIALTECRYKLMENAYKTASYKLNISAIELQAIVWLTFRRLNNIIRDKQFDIVPF
jgi:hypothetical protein